MENPYLFTAREVDILDSGSLKIQNNRHRSYNYDLARWMTADPLGVVPNDYYNPFKPKDQLGDGVNIYQYCGDEPVGNVDSYGMFSINDLWELLPDIDYISVNTYTPNAYVHNNKVRNESFKYDVIILGCTIHIVVKAFAYYIDGEEMGVISQNLQNKYSSVVNHVWDNNAKVKCVCDKKCPNGRKINVELMFVNDINTPHHIDIRVGNFEKISDTENWSTNDGDSVAGHEIGHWIGNRDEYGVYGDGTDYGKGDMMKGVMSHPWGLSKCHNFNHIFETVKKTRTISKFESCSLECER